MLHSSLAYQVAHTDGYWPRKYLVAILRYPYQVSLKIVFRVRQFGTVSHDHITRNFPSPQGEGFPPSPKGTLIINHFL